MLDAEWLACFTMLAMTKAEAIKLFDGVPKLAAALGVTRQRIYQMPDDLSTAEADRIVGAAVRLGLRESSTDNLTPTNIP